MWGFCWREGTSAGVELPLLGQGVGVMVWELTPPSPTLPATDLLSSLFLGGNKSLTHSERRNACGCCAMTPEGISWVLILPAASRGSDRPPQCLCCWGGTHRFPPGSDPPGSCPAVSPCARGTAQSQAALKTGGQTSSWRCQAEPPLLFPLFPSPPNRRAPVAAAPLPVER